MKNDADLQIKLRIDHDQQFLYEASGLFYSDFIAERQSQEYFACSFKIKNKNILYRKAKITPMKTGQFVTIWKRSLNGTIEPFHLNDSIDFLIISVEKDNFSGQFIFPKKILAMHHIFSTEHKEGKRGIRVYPAWDQPASIQAEKTQRWQQEYFFYINNQSSAKPRLKSLFE